MAIRGDHVPSSRTMSTAAIETDTGRSAEPVPTVKAATEAGLTEPPVSPAKP
jgi:hypothetical protein